MILDFLPSLLVQDLNIFPIVRTGPDSRGLMKYIFEQDCSPKNLLGTRQKQDYKTR